MDTNAARVLMRMLAGRPVEAMESAKQVIGSRPALDTALLREIVSDKIFKKWSRIAAAYALGFLGDRSSVGTLIRVLEDRQELSQLRSHAAEALGNLKDPRAVKAIGRTLMRGDQSSVKRWCVYALSEIDTRQARRFLREFKATRPTGLAAKELRSALAGFAATTSGPPFPPM